MCTGNICRSPIAELLLEQELRGTHTGITSAGTHALVGAAMPPRAQALAAQLGVEPALAQAHAGQLLTAELIADATLIVTMSREQRRYTVENWPEARRKSFTIREFARLAASVTPQEIEALRTQFPQPSERLAAAVERVAAKRGRVTPPEKPEDDDVVDPYRRSRRTYRRSGEQLAPAAASTAAFVRAILG